MPGRPTTKEKRKRYTMEFSKSPLAGEKTKPTGDKRVCTKCGKEFSGAATVLLGPGNVLAGVVCPACAPKK
jgi:DNA-directed RNA polymerase subunit RPC12/RpoP